MSQIVYVDGVNMSALPYGVRATVTTLDGWWDSPETRSQSVPRLARGGDFEAPVYDEARFIEFAANIHAPSHESMHKIGMVFTGMFRRNGGRGAFRVDDHWPGQYQFANVERASSIRFTPITDKLARLSMTLKAPDPYKYGIRNEFNGVPGTAIDIHHDGNAEAWPIFVVSGTFPGGFTVYGSSTAPIAFTDAIWQSAGDVVTIYSGTGEVYLNGNPAPGGSVGRSTLTSVAPSESRRVNVIPHDGANSTATYLVRLYDTYI
ncbi:hypothetical protein [Citricoccus sp. K5]|uniref:hypothetical protein n=1 Tax=Citricoccus sp. K5 TaxID=2653135 RepID=UPI0012F05B24|nr:hypothetical protein [Citricoccus sp. K5]VXA92262.1 conserved hypothetical protein [Citricoccus sp. K5]VXA94169.1 conserved hypothetical protein [Citricoccus sp. K5]